MQPLFMGWFVACFGPESDAPSWHPVLYGLGVVSMSAMYTVTHHRYFFGVMHTGMRMRVASCSLIYRKVRRGLFGSFSTRGNKTAPSHRRKRQGNSRYSNKIAERIGNRRK